eukprot:5534781-Prymnesium_polylepis.2
MPLLEEGRSVVYIRSTRDIIPALQRLRANASLARRIASAGRRLILQQVRPHVPVPQLLLPGRHSKRPAHAGTGEPAPRILCVCASASPSPDNTIPRAQLKHEHLLAYWRALLRSYSSIQRGRAAPITADYARVDSIRDLARVVGECSTCRPQNSSQRPRLQLDDRQCPNLSGSLPDPQRSSRCCKGWDCASMSDLIATCSKGNIQHHTALGHIIPSSNPQTTLVSPLGLTHQPVSPVCSTRQLVVVSGEPPPPRTTLHGADARPRSEVMPSRSK